ncbi:MAG: type II toxin-antitoxin system Phd/YefM family antitoxin [Candidatus Competibacteraceae bacterium]|nr:type II toxin-antitoxin system Phd/YefM family antitoxin [Candidatus Competibacteraceae bacterium]
MKTLSIREMRSELGKLDQLVQIEGELLITRQGKPIARVLPVRGARPKPSHAELRASMPRLEIPSENLVREDRDER